ncbi:MAG: Restriction endonuclease [Candidatus Amesbacteria bacterium GW2011_GWA2_47_11]|uniref:Restriction endonuclease n=1 Tax=Candidatus Amesbacteria bacterium GW2011_GWA2_47_11 TaxID=1618357 RepID=A0A0G1RDE5_9BACT|nr:MAG: Restriction endonuclease [Candidatus Amesbacteria bacterium GW2011_GWA2_47_11]
MQVDVNVEGDKSGLIEAEVHRQLTPSGRPSSRITGYVRHRGLNVERKFIENDLSVLQEQLTDQAQKWVDEWDIIEKNKEMKTKPENIKDILVDGVKTEVAVNWEKVEKKDLFIKEKPIFEELEPRLEETLPKPKIWDKLIKSRYRKLLVDQKQSYGEALKTWKEEKRIYEDEVKNWEKEKLEFEKQQLEYNEKVKNLRAEYEESKPRAIEWYLQIVLEQSSYPLDFKKKIAVEYKDDEKLLIVEYFLPCIEDFPKVKEIKYLKSRGEEKEVPFSERELNSLYEATFYKITLRSIYELFRADVKGVIDSIVFNGWVNNLNKAVGKRQDVCILSLMVDKEGFMDINLLEVDAKACFKQFQGVSASQLNVLTPIPPILRISKEDKRFIEGQAVGQGLDDSVNIAAMNWQDFEYLIREVFEREFASIGGEVRVTQSSRDKGVDAVAFDPDPIRGGKVIVQAKRYTNTVHIESARALYGIMQDEGAMKGILITTSDFGKDAYDFAKNKPISLLNGGNLLSMLHKHGYRGKIDITEARELLKETD